MFKQPNALHAYKSKQQFCEMLSDEGPARVDDVAAALDALLAETSCAVHESHCVFVHDLISELNK